MMQPLIEVHNLSRRFGDNQAVDGVSISISAGEIYGLVGPDGAGKTTTMRLLCGALRADAGQVSIAGIDLADQPERVRERIGYLPQRFSLYGDLTVMENLRFFAEIRGLGRNEWLPRAREILTFVGLDEFANRRAEALSGGMKQKLGLAAALVHRPQVLLLDEPTGGVDPVTRQAFWQLLFRLLTEGVAVLISTPYMDEASRCNRLGFLNRGKLIIEGSPQEIEARLAKRILEIEGGPRAVLERAARGDPDVESAHAFGDRLRLRLTRQDTPDIRARLKSAISGQGGDVRRVEPSSPTIEDVFIELLEESDA
jgi:drug efflux transport system ATP-binding protein